MCTLGPNLPAWGGDERSASEQLKTKGSVNKSDLGEGERSAIEKLGTAESSNKHNWGGGERPAIGRRTTRKLNDRTEPRACQKRGIYVPGCSAWGKTGHGSCSAWKAAAHGAHYAQPIPCTSLPATFHRQAGLER